MSNTDNASIVPSTNEIPSVNTTKPIKEIKKAVFPYTAFIDSANRINGTTNNFEYKIDLPKNNTFTKVIISKAIIPKTFYNYESPYNSFYVSQDNGITQRLITMPEGNYNRQTQKTKLTELLNTTAFVYAITGGLEDIPDTGKYTFTVSNNGGIQPIFIFPTLSCAEQMGFTAGTWYYFGLNPTPTNTLVSPGVMYLQGERSLFIRSNNLINTIYTNVIQEIYTNISQPYSSIVYDQDNMFLNTKEFNRSTESNIFNFTLTDEGDQPLSLNNNSFQFTLKFW